MSNKKKVGVGCLSVVALVFICGIIFLLIPVPSQDETISSESGKPTTTISSRLDSATDVPPTETLPTTIPATDTPVPSVTPTPSLDIVTLPLQIESEDGWTLIVESIEQLPSIDTDTKRYRPENGIFAVLTGTLGNFTDENECLTGDRVALVDSSGNQYDMNADLLDALKSKYDRDYPGFFLGQCLDYDATDETFLVFDVPERSSLALKLNDTSVHIGQMEAYQPVVSLETPTALPEPTQGTNISSIVTPEPIETVAAIPQAVLNTNANLRSGPGTEHEIIDLGEAGNTYVVYARTDDGWLLLDTTGKTWVASSLVSLNQEQSLIPIWDGKPIESNEVTLPLGNVSGLGISENDFFEVFVEPNGLFEFEPPSELINGERRVLGQTSDTSAVLELIGPSDDLYQATLITIWPTDENKLIELAAITAVFVKVAIPTWDGANDWFMDNMVEASQTDGNASIVHDDKVLEVTVINELGLLMFSVRIEGYGG